jgi:D-alanine-D-alanine ligase
VIPGRDFYDYIDKYVGTSSRTIVPAELSATARTSIEALARRAYVTLECAGMARVDFFLNRADGQLLVNEINTIPGFTSASLFPRMWEAAGVPFAALVDRLIALALARHTSRAALSTSFEVVAPPARTARPGGRRREQMRSGRRVRGRSRR